ncbi:MAG: phosphoribosylanthranilate isomerase [Euryarchaeota archaeon]|nr:phosphoribosylanthranilate isomerase [Euryarchaeota archaeon]
MVRVKICGNTSVEDVELVSELGADFAGFIVEVPVDTPRKISLAQAERIMEEMPFTTAGVMVIMPRSVEEALNMYLAVRPDFIQLHGDESPRFVRELRGLVSCNIIKTIHVRGEESIALAKRYVNYVDAILLDTPSARGGGSGRVHDWEVSRRIVEALPKPVILAGGLTPENVAEAVRVVKPYAVDVSSGVEASPGRKDPEKVRRFIERARGEE